MARKQQPQSIRSGRKTTSSLFIAICIAGISRQFGDGPGLLIYQQESRFT